MARQVRCESPGLNLGPGSGLGGSSAVEAGGIPGVAVKCVEMGRNTSGEGGLLGFN